MISVEHTGGQVVVGARAKAYRRELVAKYIIRSFEKLNRSCKNAQNIQKYVA